jgi:hypothetical protein
VYFLGIIDIFTHFDVRKKLENIYKSLAQDPDTISCVPPEKYAQRFFDFLKYAFK